METTRRRLARIAPAALSALLCSATTGCTTATKYKLAPPDTPPAVRLDWTTPDAILEARLQSVIVCRGPGSWKREARWDEYVVTLANRHGQPVEVTAVELVDATATALSPGVDPWALERLSETNRARYAKAGLRVVAGAGAATLYTGGTAVAATAVATGATGAGALALIPLAPLVAAVDIATVAVIDRSNKAKIAAEFARRRLPVPCTVAAGATVQGSWFFPVAPGPQCLAIRGLSEGRPYTLRPELGALRELHRAPARPVARAARPGSRPSEGLAATAAGLPAMLPLP